MVKIMNQHRRLSRHNSRQSSIGETTSVCSARSVKSNGSNDNNPSTTSQSSNNNKKHPNGLSKHGSQDSGDSKNCGSQPKTILNVAEMLLHGVADNEILNSWLLSIDCGEFVSNFQDAGYDMPTISRVTPQDLTAIGVTDPTTRLKILTEIKKLNLQDGIPNFIPASLSHWLNLIRLDSYYFRSLCDQKIDTIEKFCQLTWEDFEELGITRLGHQKRFQLAIERIKVLKEDARCSAKHMSEPIYDVNPSQILLVASAENHSMNGPIINKQSSTSELSSTGSGSMQSVYSAASAQYQPTYALLTDSSQAPNTTSHIPNATINYVTQQNQQAVFTQSSTTPLFYQQSPCANGAAQRNQNQQNHYHQVYPAQQLSMQFACSNNDGALSSNGRAARQMNSQQNRQSMSQLPFAALSKLPSHQQQILQQSSIYATLRRHSSRPSKQPPPPVPVRTNSLKTNSMTDETYICHQSGPQCSQHQQQQQQIKSQYQQPHLTQQQKPPSLQKTQPTQFSSISQYQPQQANQKQHNFQMSCQPPSNNCQTSPTDYIMSLTDGLVSAHCNATTGRDDDFPSPPSPLSLNNSEENDLDLHNSDNNFTDVAHGMMTFRVGI